jgi:pimeloyl-ACP methyl ester carboxylesterase
LGVENEGRVGWGSPSASPEWLALDVSSLAASSVPVLLTQGDESDPSFARILDHLARGVPRAKRRTLRRVGHVPHATRPDEYAQLIEFIFQANSNPTRGNSVRRMPAARRTWLAPFILIGDWR